MEILNKFFSLFEDAGSGYVWYRLFILALGVGFVVSSVVLALKRKYLGGVVRALYAADATSPEKAKKFAELGLAESRIVMHSLESGTLSRMLGCVEKDKHDEAMRAVLSERSEESSSSEKEKKNSKKAKIITRYKPKARMDSFYLPEEKSKQMLSLFSEKGSGVLSVLITILFAAVVVVALWYFMPYILSMIENSIG